MSKEKTTDEIRENFLRHIRCSINYWNNVTNYTTKEKLEGLTSSILTMLDGGSGGLPRFIVAPIPHPTDKDYHEKNNEDYYPENHEIEEKIKGDIAGCLHELLHKED